MLTGVGLLAFGYYIGREVGKHDHIRRELKENNASQNMEDAVKSEAGSDKQ